ncbi:MAG: hypothetical protein IJI73_10970 [Kiritimatiellae bacterium]|nr:hypothetical protein [Kiritimatiellia bacterium]
MSNMNLKAKNTCKWKSYTLAFGRIKTAIQAGFPVEAIALEESVIADRLRSVLTRAMPALKDGRGYDVGALVVNARMYIAPREDKLLTDINDWIRKRNIAIHGIVATKSGGEAKIPADNFVSNAMSVAKRGEILAHKLSDWARKEIRKIERRKKP